MSTVLCLLSIIASQIILQQDNKRLLKAAQFNHHERPQSLAFYYCLPLSLFAWAALLFFLGVTVLLSRSNTSLAESALAILLLAIWHLLFLFLISCPPRLLRETGKVARRKG
jgi:hypothetical protein